MTTHNPADYPTYDAYLTAVKGKAKKISRKATAAPAAIDITALTVRFVSEWQAMRRTDCPLNELYARLTRHDAALSIGAFHDLLRSLHASGALRLGSWSGPLDRIPVPELALFVSSKVMYDAHVPEGKP